MCDGDKSLVVQDPDIIQAAKRNTEKIVPLYYEMKKAGAQPITKENIYDSMILAYVGGNIGQISNDISIIWNEESCENRLDVVKLLCMENNHTIDFAKTLYKPVRPEKVHSMIHQYTRKKVPHFFVYAKDKSENQVEPPNNSPVNRLEYIIPEIKMDFKTQSLGKFDPKMLMRENIIPTNEITKQIIETYDLMTKSDAMKTGRDERGVPRSVYGYQQIIDALLCICNDIYFVTDVLIKELFIRRRSKRKNIFWMCFGNVVAENVRKNIGRKTGMCVKCGARFYRESNRQVMCKSCAAQSRKISNRLAQRRRTAKKSAFKKDPESTVVQ